MEGFSSFISLMHLTNSRELPLAPLIGPPFLQTAGNFLAFDLRCFVALFVRVLLCVFLPSFVSFCLFPVPLFILPFVPPFVPIFVPLSPRAWLHTSRLPTGFPSAQNKIRKETTNAKKAKIAAANAD